MKAFFSVGDLVLDIHNQAAPMGIVVLPSVASPDNEWCEVKWFDVPQPISTKINCLRLMSGESNESRGDRYDS